jgi:predicted ATP-grasp superfamily ATP-dependent carboligase
MTKKDITKNECNIFFKAKYIPEQIQNDIFANRLNWNKIPDSKINKSTINFVYLDDLYYTNPSYYSIKCTAKNIVNDEKRAVSLKNNFVTTMMNDPIGQKYILPHHVIDLYEHELTKQSLVSYLNLKKISELFTKNAIYIFKPVTGMSGKGIKIIDTYEKLINYIQYIKQKNIKQWQRYKDPNKAPMRVWVLQEYLTNPLTVKKRDGKSYKFHIRHYYLYQPKAIGKSYYYDMGEIATARAPYVKGHWDNKLIHDTHFYEDDDELYPDFLKLSPLHKQSIDTQISEVYSIINKYNNAQCYNDSKYCFEIFGLDIMLTDDYQLKVIEVNANPGNPFGNYMDLKYNFFNDAFKLTVDNWLNTEYVHVTESKYLQKGKFIEIMPSSDDKLVMLSTKGHDTVCTGLQAQCNATASTPNSRPFCSLFTRGLSPERKREVGLEFSVGSTKHNKYTYYVKSDYYTEKYIDSVFDSSLWTKVSDSERASYIANKTPIDYIYLDGKHYYNPANFKLIGNVKNLVDDSKRDITAKNNLMTNLAKIPNARKYLMPQYELDLYMLHTNTEVRTKTLARLSPLFNNKKIFIFKPVTGFAGQGIKMMTSMNELESYINLIIKENNKKWKGVDGKSPADKLRIWVLQEYLTDPLLIKQPAHHGYKAGDYKFHIRHYLFYMPGKTSYYVYEGEIAPARAPYIKGNWHNKLIHDTHFYGRDGELFPAALKLSHALTNNIYAQISELYTHILSCINAKCYAESRACYELFGVDLMITHDYNVKVIEVNEKLGMPSSLTPMSRILFEGCLHKIVMPLLGLTVSSNDISLPATVEKKYDKHFIEIKKRESQTKKATISKRLTHATKTRKMKPANKL